MMAPGVLSIEVRSIPPTSPKHGHREQASTNVANGRFVVSRITARTSCIADLCRRLVEVDVPDGPWLTRHALGTVCLRGKSIHRHAGVDARESDGTGAFGYHRWRPFPDGLKTTPVHRDGASKDGVSGAGAPPVAIPRSEALADEPGVVRLPCCHTVGPQRCLALVREPPA